MPAIERADLDAISAIVTVNIPTADYLPMVNQELKNYRKKVKLKGFRKGRVPMGIVKRKFGNTVLAKKVKERVDKELNDYLGKEKIALLVEPILIPDSSIDFNINKPQDYNFRFKLGLTPKFDVQGISGENVLPFYNVTISDEMVAFEKDHIRKHFGEGFEENVTNILDEDVILIDLQELENEDIKEGGLSKESIHIMVRQISDAGLKSQLYAATVGDSLNVNVYHLSVNGREHIRRFILDIPEDQEINPTFRMTIKHIRRVKKADVNAALFQKIFPKEKEPITTEEAFDKRLRDEIHRAYHQQSQKKFYNEIYESLIKLNNFDLPGDLLKEWLLNTRRADATTISDVYNQFAKATRWSLIRNKIASDNNIKVNPQEVEVVIRREVLSYLDEKIEPFDSGVNDMVRKAMEDDGVVTKHSDKILDEHVVKHVAKLIQKDIKNVTKEEFEAIVKANQKARTVRATRTEKVVKKT